MLCEYTCAVFYEIQGEEQIQIYVQLCVGKQHQPPNLQCQSTGSRFVHNGLPDCCFAANSSQLPTTFSGILRAAAVHGMPLALKKPQKLTFKPHLPQIFSCARLMGENICQVHPMHPGSGVAPQATSSCPSRWYLTCTSNTLDSHCKVKNTD